jgi:hypothetical protein
MLLVVLKYVGFPLSLQNVKDLLFKRGIDISHKTVRRWWNRFGPLFLARMRRQRVRPLPNCALKALYAEAGLSPLACAPLHLPVGPRQLSAVAS